MKDNCLACHPTRQEIDAITGAVFPSVFDKAFDTAVLYYKTKDPDFDPVKDQPPLFLMLIEQLLNQLVPQAVHSGLHSGGSVLGHSMVLS